ncbi:MAG TPA: metalloregulator ArsR/SmtB family transcription factor [Candidatus Krumholzibacteriaceae bacterium]|nr:metalloregulator ArsR/SmtB family transcription factor [Candidatus Krumholzibacteriaceae bacterium]
MDKKRKAFLSAKAKVLKALAHPTRLYMVEELAGGEKCVCKLNENIDADFSTISKHLSVLKQAGIVRDEKRGKMVFYTLEVPCVLQFMGCIEETIKSRAEAQMNMLK